MSTKNHHHGRWWWCGPGSTWTWIWSSWWNGMEARFSGFVTLQFKCFQIIFGKLLELAKHTKAQPASFLSKKDAFLWKWKREIFAANICSNLIFNGIIELDLVSINIYWGTSPHRQMKWSLNSEKSGSLLPPEKHRKLFCRFLLKKRSRSKKFLAQTLQINYLKSYAFSNLELNPLILPFKSWFLLFYEIN